MPFKMIAQDVNKDKLSPLNIECTHAKCDDQLHSYRQKPKSKKIILQEDFWATPAQKKGSCWACGIDLVDWPRVHNKDLSDVIYTFDMLNTELVRYVYWHTPIDQKAINHALRKGKPQLHFAAENRLRRCVAKPENYREGHQTPKQGNIIFYAQHATACCCRNCMEYWHNIPMGIQLSDPQINYFVELIMLYATAQMPQLQENGIKVPPIRNNGRLFVNGLTSQLEQSSLLLNHQEVQDQRIGEEDEYFVPSDVALPV